MAATALLGRPLDPHGKYAFGGIAPTPASWKRGERSLACGIVSRDSEGSTFALFTGDARNAPDQTRLRPVGTATRYLGRAADGRRTRPGWFPIAAESWDAGRQKTECSVGIYGSDGNPEPVSGPIRHQTG